MKYPNERQGTFAEEFVANEYGLAHAPNEAEWYDCVDESTGTKYEVKSTHRVIDTRDPDEFVGGDGRFRLWYDQHRKLAARDGQKGSAAWYAFVLLDDAGDVIDHRRMHPTTVTPLVRDLLGGWDVANHEQRQSEQQKIPWPAVFDDK